MEVYRCVECSQVDENLTGNDQTAMCKQCGGRLEVEEVDSSSDETKTDQGSIEDGQGKPSSPSIHFACTHCSQWLSAPAKTENISVLCAYCKSNIVIPQLSIPLPPGQTYRAILPRQTTHISAKKLQKQTVLGSIIGSIFMSAFLYFLMGWSVPVMEKAISVPENIIKSMAGQNRSGEHPADTMDNIMRGKAVKTFSVGWGLFGGSMGILFGILLARGSWGGTRDGLKCSLISYPNTIDRTPMESEIHLIILNTSEKSHILKRADNVRLTTNIAELGRRATITSTTIEDLTLELSDRIVQIAPGEAQEYLLARITAPKNFVHLLCSAKYGDIHTGETEVTVMVGKGKDK